MKVRIHAIALTIAFVSTLHGLDWTSVWSQPASIRVVNMEAVPLVASDDGKSWARVPLHLATYGARVHMPTGSTNGIADIEVTGSGYLMLACNYDYQGNASGDWQKDVWDISQFQEKGWRRMKPGELGGLLVKGDNREQIVFVKRVKEGDRLRIRCNKHDPPFPILVAPPSIQQVSAAER